MIKLVEYGPFGCQLERGMIKSLDEIPQGYVVIKVESKDEMIVYVDPVKKEDTIVQS